MEIWVCPVMQAKNARAMGEMIPSIPTHTINRIVCVTGRELHSREDIGGALRGDTHGGIMRCFQVLSCGGQLPPPTLQDAMGEAGLRQ